MGGHKKQKKSHGGHQNSGVSTKHSNNNQKSGGRNANPSERRNVITKGKGEITALPGKELKSAAGRMMSNVLKRRRREEAHHPGKNNNNNNNNKVNFRNNNNNSNNNNNNYNYNNNNNNNGDDNNNDDDDYDQQQQQGNIRQAMSFAVDARQRQAYHNATQQSIESRRQEFQSMSENPERSLKRFFKNLKDVIDQSDVLLEIVDSRDPIGCRLTDVENMIESEYGGRKKVVLVMNKIDLLPNHHINSSTRPHEHQNAKSNTSSKTLQQEQNADEGEVLVPMVEWLRFFRESHSDVKVTEVCPFTCSDNHASTSQQHQVSSSTKSRRNNNNNNNDDDDEEYDEDEYQDASGSASASSSTTTTAINQEWCVSNLFNILRRLATVDGSGGARKNISVGVFGYPNVGKSSVINALRGKAVVGVGNTPGFTTGNTMVDLRKDIKIIDCPGVVMPGEDAADIVLRNAAKVEKLQNPMLVVCRLLARCDPVALAMYYDVPIPQVSNQNQNNQQNQKQNNFQNQNNNNNQEDETTNIAVLNAVTEFLRNVAWKRGRVKTNGSIDEDDAARLVLKDWNDGKISYYSLPPAIDQFSFFSPGTVATKNFQQNVNDVSMVESFSESATVFGKSHLPRFFIQMPQDGERTFRVAWNTDSMFCAPAGSDAPITYNPMDNIDETTGMLLNDKKKDNKKKQQQQQSTNNNNENNNTSVVNSSSSAASAAAAATNAGNTYLAQLYGQDVNED